MKHKSNNYRKQTNYLKAIIICHGASEYHIAKHIKSNLRLKIEIDGKDNGKHSIQINSILNFLNTVPYKSKTDFIKKFKHDLPNGTINSEFKIFIIMDTDDEELTPSDIDNFKNKNMFKGHWTYDYIVPIYNIQNLEDILLKAKIIDKTFEDKKEYAKIFSVNNNASIGDIGQIQNMYNILQPITDTNMDILLEYLLNLVK